MTRVFEASGESIPVTVVEAGPCPIIDRKTRERDGYDAYKVGFGVRKKSRITKPYEGLFKGANVEPTQYLREVRYDEAQLDVGSELTVSMFAEGDMVDVTGTWSPLELEPYRKLIEAGLTDAIMTAHVFNADLDAKNPATLSPAIINDLLRGELNYYGVVISDVMQMAAITDYYGFETAIQKRIEAGVDIIAIANNSVYEEDVVTRTVTLIERLVAAGTISEARIDQSYRRIQRLKNRLPAAE